MKGLIKSLKKVQIKDVSQPKRVRLKRTNSFYPNRGQALFMSLKQLGAEEICNIGCQNHEIAVEILTDPFLCDKLAEKNSNLLKSTTNNMNEDYIANNNPFYLLAKSNEIIFEFIKNHFDLKNRLSDEQIIQLEEIYGNSKYF